MYKFVAKSPCKEMRRGEVKRNSSSTSKYQKMIPKPRQSCNRKVAAHEMRVCTSKISMLTALQ